MSCCIRSHVAEWKPASFSGDSDPQSSTQQKICHIAWTTDSRVCAKFWLQYKMRIFFFFTSNFMLWTAMDVWVRGSEFKVQCYDGVVAYCRQQYILCKGSCSLLQVKSKSMWFGALVWGLCGGVYRVCLQTSVWPSYKLWVTPLSFLVVHEVWHPHVTQPSNKQKSN